MCASEECRTQSLNAGSIQNRLALRNVELRKSLVRRNVIVYMRIRAISGLCIRRMEWKVILRA